MSFSSSKNWSLSKDKHINSRRVAVRSCIVCCLCYGNLKYSEMVNYYTKKFNLNSDNLNDMDIEKIIEELTILRKKSIELIKIYTDYRIELKKSGFRSNSKKTQEFKNNINNQIMHLWKEYKTESS